jgi:transcriptional regulator with XRE-family HTH domain
MSETRSMVDHFIGARIRERRKMIGLSQPQLGELIGVSYQQVHNYERGDNSISAGRLYEIACELGAPLEYFFEGLKRNERRMPDRRRRLLDTMRYLGEIETGKHREAISQLIRALAGH